MKYKFQVRSYKRSFKKPLITSQCILREREGLIIRLENDSENIGFGEIAPMPFLGSESFKDAKAFCSQIGNEINNDFIASINPTLPCCRHGIHSAFEMLQHSSSIQREFEVTALLSLANEQPSSHYADYKTFKCKIGISSFEKEKEAFIKFHANLPEGAKLRLDANGALSQNETKKWLNFLDDHSDCKIQFLEQPLSKGQESLMAELIRDHRTPIALDESIVTSNDFQKILENEWPGWIIIKSSLIGDINHFRKLREQCILPIVYSSVFETAIGIEAGLALAATDNKNNHALGFGTIDYFPEDKFGFHQNRSYIRSGKMSVNNYEKIWELCEISK
jgi:O-succinylbenzoate synthase